MGPTDESPIEPLSDRAWSRVEAGLFARLDRGEHLVGEAPASGTAPTLAARAPRALRRWGLATTAFAAAAGLALWLQSGASPELAADAGHVAPIASEPGAPSGATTAPAPQAAERAARLADGARVATTTEPEQLLIGDSSLTLSARSALSVAGSDASGWRLELESGRVECEVAPRAGRPAFIVDAGEARVTVIGTRFSVAREPSGARVDVEHGSVRVSTAGVSVLLSAGQSWPVATPPPAAGERARARTPEGADPAARFERAGRLESSNPEAALRIYRELSQKPGPWAPNALYAAARLELERQHTRRGRSQLELYLKRYPEGANAADARHLLGRR